MTDIDPNSPANLRALMLYDISQRKTMRESIDNHRVLCKHLGKKAISYDEYELCFYRCLYENYHSKIAKRDLSVPDIHVCILSDVIDRKTAKKSIDDLCDAFKNHKIDKKDHGYWFKRFENGKSFTRVTFSDFPEDVVAEIVGKCDIKSYLNLRNVSSGLRTVIDQLAPPCTDIEVHCGLLKFYVNGALLADSISFNTPNSHLPIEEIERRMPGTLTLLLRNPKLQLKNFLFYTVPGPEETLSDTETVINLINSFNRKLHVKNCSIGVDSEKELIGILQCFKPGTLEQIELLIDLFPLSNEIVEIDQWKQAKHLRLEGFNLPSIDHLLHFSTIEASVDPISLEDLVMLCKSIPLWTNFEYIKIENEERWDTGAVKRALNLHPTASPRMYSIPNTNLIVQFERGNSNWLKIYKN